MTADYRYIKAWGRLLHSQDYYIIDQVKRARETNAPERAVFQRDDGTWAILDECVQTTQDAVEQLVAK